MLTDILEHFGLSKSFPQADYFETEHRQQLARDLKLAAQEGGLIALTGIVGCGKTRLVWHLLDTLKRENDIEVAESLAVEKRRVALNTLMMALFYDLASEKVPTLPATPELRERLLTAAISQREKPVALFVDDAHDLHRETLLGLKRLIELARRRGGCLSVVLIGHPKLKNDLSDPVLEEIGARASVLELEGIKGSQRHYMTWLLEQCKKPKVRADQILAEPALDLLAERLVTPLQIEYYVTKALEHAYRLGEKPVTTDIIETVLSPQLDALEPTLTRHGYNPKVLASVLNARPAEIRAFLNGKLPPTRTQELQQSLLAVGLAL
jgi:type II secretory pathway predicted ATPase ExeA